MTKGLSLVSIDENPVKVGLTDQNQITQFLHNLLKADADKSAKALLEEIKTLNRQPLDINARIQILERYFNVSKEIVRDLEDSYGNTKIPLDSESKSQASLAEGLWLELGYGYKRALSDLKKILIHLKTKELNTLTIVRTLEALKYEARVKYLSYTPLSDSFWSDLHKVYYHALQLNLEDTSISNDTQSINLIYKQILLTYLSNPQRLSKFNIIKLFEMIDGLASYSAIRGLGVVENPNGLFIIKLDQPEPPIAYYKNNHTTNLEKDILLITVEVARQIHHQLQLIEANGPSLESNKHENLSFLADKPLLKHLIAYLGAPPIRGFPRREKQLKAKLIFGFDNLHIIFRNSLREESKLYSEWQVLNIAPTGYALKKNDLQKGSIEVGDLVAILDEETKYWTIGQLAWAQIKALNSNQDSIEIGVKLVAPQSTSVSYQVNNKPPQKALLLPAIKLLNQKESIIFKDDAQIMQGDIITIKKVHNKIKLKLNRSIEKSKLFSQHEYSLIHSDLS